MALGILIFVALAVSGVLPSPLMLETKPGPKQDPAFPSSVFPNSKRVQTVSKLVPSLSTSTSRQQCRAVNEDFDRALDLANQEFLQTGHLMFPVDGFQQNVYLSYSGVSLFLKFNLKTSGGSLRLSTATRDENVTVCNSNNVGQSEETLHAVFRFGNVELNYSKLHAEYFKWWKFDGTLSYDVRPAIDVVATRSSDVCHLDVVTFHDTTHSEYKVTSDSWKDWVVAQLVGKSLRDGGDSTPILRYVLDGLRNFVEVHFLKNWCKNTAKVVS